jgi:two-component system sensor histidine kinase KdpD
VDVPVTADVHLALRGRPLPAEARGVLETAAGQALLALRHQRMRRDAADAKRRAETTELRTALLSAVGHDLRTPLTSIKAAAGSLRAPDLRLSQEDSAELLATIEESADRLSGLVGNLLDSSRLATGAVRPMLRAVTYDEVVARALSGVDGRAAVAVDVAESLPPVLADPGLLERVVANVVDNALRHGRPERPVAPGEPAIAVRASAYSDRVELRVVDHGRGLPKGTAGTASGTEFAPFQRLGDTSSGIGLGMSVAKGFVDAMGGTIRTEDTPGGGLTVVISLPADGEGQP